MTHLHDYNLPLDLARIEARMASRRRQRQVRWRRWLQAAIRGCWRGVTGGRG